MTSSAKGATSTNSPDLAILDDWENAPGVIEGAMAVEIDPHDCGIEYWIKDVAQGQLQGLVRGRKPQSKVPQLLMEPGPLRETLISEFAFRSLSEEGATRACALVAAASNDVTGLEFYTTQALDEARHAQTFREHLLDMGIPADQLHSTIEAYAGDARDRILGPMWEWGVPAFADSFINGVAIVTILLEGVLAPTTELSERKWAPLSQAAADVERGACVDEIRHLAAGSWFIREHLREHPEDRDPLVELLFEGRQRWDSLPTVEFLAEREALYQQGLEQHRDQIGDCEMFPGRRLVDTTVEERLLATLQWSHDVQAQRLAYMGLGEVIPKGSRPVATHLEAD